jgi:hypothetical protein
LLTGKEQIVNKTASLQSSSDLLNLLKNNSFKHKVNPYNTVLFPNYLNQFNKPYGVLVAHSTEQNYNEDYFLVNKTIKNEFPTKTINEINNIY